MAAEQTSIPKPKRASKPSRTEEISRFSSTTYMGGAFVNDVAGLLESKRPVLKRLAEKLALRP